VSSNADDLNLESSPSTLQEASRDQAAAIRQLVLSTGINPIGLDWRRFVVALDQQKEVIGCGQLKPHRDGSVELASIAVAKSWRRQGVASAIIEYLIEKYDNDLYLMCESSLGPIYEKFDFAPIEIDEMPPYFRAISRIANFLGKLFRREKVLLVMFRPKG
jgi:N-acetylglutamate synthase-like GNAT family acetyltransferase